MSAVYRVRQFIQATGAWIRPAKVEEALLERYLPPQSLELFRAMPSQDRKHGLNVFRTLQQEGYDDPDLLAAALLHDVGKGVPPGGGPRLWHRVAVVLMHRYTPELLQRLAADGRGWKEPFAVHVRHPHVGAQWAAEAGCSPQVVSLIREHHEPDPKNELLAALQWADKRN